MLYSPTCLNFHWNDSIITFIVIQALNLGLDDTNLPTSETDMSRYVSEPLGNGEDELEFYTKSLIDKMNSPGVCYATNVVHFRQDHIQFIIIA